MRWLQMDATQMGEADASYDVVIDKSVLDTFACMDHADAIAAKYLGEVRRVLRPGGTLLCISYSNARRAFLEASPLDFEIRDVTLPPKTQGSYPHYVYICRRPALHGHAEEASAEGA